LFFFNKNKKKKREVETTKQNPRNHQTLEVGLIATTKPNQTKPTNYENYKIPKNA